jgi:hypothetical protein
LPVTTPIGSTRYGLRICRNTATGSQITSGFAPASVTKSGEDKEQPELPTLPDDCYECPTCGGDTKPSGGGQRIDDGRYFYGLTFHDPNYDASKAVIGEDCSDRTLSNEDQTGKTVEQAERAGVSFGLERIQAVYKASSKHPTERHTVPSIDGACGFESVVKIMEAIDLRLEWVKGRRNRRDDMYILHDDR